MGYKQHSKLSAAWIRGAPFLLPSPTSDTLEMILSWYKLTNYCGCQTVFTPAKEYYLLLHLFFKNKWLTPMLLSPAKDQVSQFLRLVKAGASAVALPLCVKTN